MKVTVSNFDKSTEHVRRVHLYNKGDVLIFQIDLVQKEYKDISLGECEDGPVSSITIDLWDEPPTLLWPVCLATIVLKSENKEESSKIRNGVALQRNIKNGAFIYVVPELTAREIEELQTLYQHATE